MKAAEPIERDRSIPGGSAMALPHIKLTAWAADTDRSW